MRSPLPPSPPAPILTRLHKLKGALESQVLDGETFPGVDAGEDRHKAVFQEAPLKVWQVGGRATAVQRFWAVLWSKRQPFRNALT